MSEYVEPGNVLSRDASVPPEDHALLEAARTGDLTAVGRVCDRHGAALFALANIISGDREFARLVAVDVLKHACTAPEQPAEGALISVRHDLARLIYRRCAKPSRFLGYQDDLEPRHRGRAGTDRPRDGGCDLIAELAVLADQQRTAVALALLGDHSYRDIGSLMGLPPQLTASLVSSGLNQLGTPPAQVVSLQRTDSVSHRRR
ncbi:RNA polymerase sigma factor [Tenggerimyces flavus]|uniref:RNA polymerase sigma factor n=1 Tax=Tenggerimyces flavus TaxID=1708749 RepID=A0ABV7YB17_9ACTN|nr:hypothetical protein [Tenggerimyces flavus]MBM7789735.1 DNA-directed RNA polymerase specialized sigma24 family protein [Tenggerimyces flavus]